MVSLIYRIISWFFQETNWEIKWESSNSGPPGKKAVKIMFVSMLIVVMLIVTYVAHICMCRNIIEQPFFSYADIQPGTVMAVCLTSAFIDCFINFSFSFPVRCICARLFSAKYVITSVSLLTSFNHRISACWSEVMLTSPKIARIILRLLDLDFVYDACVMVSEHWRHVSVSLYQIRYYCIRLNIIMLLLSSFFLSSSLLFLLYLIMCKKMASHDILL